MSWLLPMSPDWPLGKTASRSDEIGIACLYRLIQMPGQKSSRAQFQALYQNPWRLMDKPRYIYKEREGREKMISYTVTFKKQQGMTEEFECPEQVPVLWAPDQSLSFGKHRGHLYCLSSLSLTTLHTVTWAGKGHAGKP